MYLQNVGLYLDQSLGTLTLFSTLIGIEITLFCAGFRKLSPFLFWFVGTERVRAMGN